MTWFPMSRSTSAFSRAFPSWSPPLLRHFARQLVAAQLFRDEVSECSLHELRQRRVDVQ